jgi:hypothetical protein
VTIHDVIREWLPCVPKEAQARIEAEAAAFAAQGEQRWAANRKLLSVHHAALCERVEAARDLPRPLAVPIVGLPWRLDLAAPARWQTADYVLLLSSTDGRLVPLNVPTQLEEVESTILLGHQDDLRGRAVLLGSLARYDVLRNVLANPPIARSGTKLRRQAVYVVEEDLGLVAMFLRSVVLDGAMASDRVHWFVGRGAVGELQEFFRVHRLRPLPHTFLCATPAVREAIATVKTQRARRYVKLSALLPRRYPPEWTHSLRAVLTGKVPRQVRVWLHTTLALDFQYYHLHDLADAFRAAGAEVYLFKEHDGFEAMMLDEYVDRFLAFQPDVVLLVNENRFFPIAYPSALPLLTWIQDDLPHLHDPEGIKQAQPTDITFCMCNDFVTLSQRLGYPHVHLLRMGANETLYVPDPELPPPRDEVAVMMHMDPAHDDATRVRQAQRTEPVRWLKEAGVPLALYGRGWDRLPEFAAHARGEAWYGRELALAYQRSKVVLQVNANTNCHQRVFEGLAAGGFVVAKANPNDHLPGELASQLRIGEEICVFATRSELVATVGRAFADEGWRREVIEAGRRRVLGEHTYTHRAREILTILRATLG